MVDSEILWCQFDCSGMDRSNILNFLNRLFPLWATLTGSQCVDVKTIINYCLRIPLPLSGLLSVSTPTTSLSGLLSVDNR